MLELCGAVWHQADSTSLLLDAVFARCEAPPASVVSRWPGWKRPASATCKKSASVGGGPCSAQVRSVLGWAGADLVASLLRADPSRRPTSQEASVAEFLHSHFRGGEQVHAGERHDWSLMRGVMPEEVLNWLRSDLLDPCDATLRSILVRDIDFSRKGPNIKHEQGRKLIIGGRMVREPCSGSMCKLKLDEPLPLPRVRAWLRSFKQINKQALVELESRVRRATRQLPAELLKTNAADLLGLPLDSWFASCAELAISDARGNWAEPLHQDGGASVVHGSVTLFGCRTLRCHTTDDQVVCTENFPGLVYWGGLTGPRHQVVHKDVEPDLLLHGKYSVTVQLRTSLFAQSRSRLKDTTPSPVEFFHALASVVRQSFGDLPWSLPSLTQCQEALDIEEGRTAGAEASVKKNQSQEETTAVAGVSVQKKKAEQEKAPVAKRSKYHKQ